MNIICIHVDLSKGSDRSMRRHYQDGMTIVRKFGKPDLFITFTANPSWPEIKKCLRNGEFYIDRPDICVRVFYIKFNAFLNEILKKKIFGLCIK